MPNKCIIERSGEAIEDAKEFTMGCDLQVLHSSRLFSHLFQTFMFMLIEILTISSVVFQRDQMEDQWLFVIQVAPRMQHVFEDIEVEDEDSLSSSKDLQDDEHQSSDND